MRNVQTNGQVKVANKVVKDSLKKILETLGGKLVDEMENVKWVIRATPNKLTCIKPFILVYGYEAVALIEIVMAWDREKILQLNSQQ